MKIFTLLVLTIALVACNTAEKQTAEPEPATIEKAELASELTVEATDVADVPTVADNVPEQPMAIEEAVVEAGQMDNVAQSSIDMPAAEPVIDIDPKYLITSQSAGVFKAGEKVPIKLDGYNIRKTAENTDYGMEYATATYDVSENGQTILQIKTYINNNDWHKSGVSTFIYILSDKFKTDKGIGVGSTIEEFVAA